MIIILLGPPGAGKGTQAKMICKKKKLFHFSTGEILRNEVEKKTKIGEKIDQIINEGRLVSDDIIISIVEKIISEEFSKNDGILFDGFPRNLDQANAFEELLNKVGKKIDCVLHITIDKDEVVERIKKRGLEENRKDDNSEILKSRIEVYLKETSPLINLYKKKNILEKIDGMKSIENVNNDINKILN
ncbi:MAG: adenylate kinase [Alphaproteobacteria bacterium MarineAlpha6_Bin3]|nr:MAG: adenylate kinase [Alphaproteobacteria bacterium MarineAlpha6_Bin3]|tara:strand:+ start:22706 stop:23269 length:564 start_codon:yes stop_codon:yes gene_type:complete